MDISIITPYYKGSEFLTQYINTLTLAINNIKNIFSYEVIIINDSPSENIVIDENIKKNLNIKIINNKSNQGIHQARINGLNKSNGKFILFLDQDDVILEDSLKILLDEIENFDVCIGNGFYEFKNNSERIFKNNMSGKFATKKIFYLYVKNFIISPGQCLIRKNAIPEKWSNKSLINNGADDYLLWLLMFEQKSKFKYVHKDVYIHKYTGENLSIQKEKMFNSNKELLDRLEQCNFSRKDLKKLKASINYKYFYKEHFIKETFKHIIVFFYNVAYKLIWSGCVVTDKKLKKG